MKNDVKCYHYIVIDDDKVVEEGYVDPCNFEEVGKMLRSNLGELRKHIYEEYKDGTRLELILADESIYKFVTPETDSGGVYYLSEDSIKGI